MEQRIIHLELALQQAAHPLPGSAPRENRRPLNIRAIHDGFKLLDALAALFPQISILEWENRCDAGRFIDYNGRVCSKDHVVCAGERLLQIFPPASEPAVCADIRILYEDDALILVNKPAPLPMHASGRFHRNTLQYLMNKACSPLSPKPVHRLDANTTGLILFARTRHFCHLMQRQFIDGDVVKQYLVRVSGHPENDVFFSDAPISSGPGILGTRGIDAEKGKASRTNFQVIQRNSDGTTLLEATLETGRTNQIRVHLWAMNLPVMGDSAYLAAGKIGNTQTMDIQDPPLCLHAWKISFRHPLSEEMMHFETPLPDWAQTETYQM